MKIIFMGTPEFSVPTLKALNQAGHTICAVVTQPDRKRGRGQQLLAPPVKQQAEILHIPVWQPERIRESHWVSEIEKLQPDVIVVVAFGQILSKEILETPKYGCLNVHASLLPKYRGAAPIQRAILEGEKKTGITIMQMEERLDAGDILHQAEYVLDDKETGGSLHDRLSSLGAQCLLEVLKQLEVGNVSAIKQDEKKASYAKRLEKTTGKIHFSKSAQEIERCVRACNPWPSAFTSWRGKQLKVWDANVIEQTAKGTTGEVVCVTESEIWVKTGENILSLKEVQLEGKKRMPVAQFLKGNAVEPGEILGVS